ncbi:MAG: 50S ribosomal protein L29 [Candidatus Pacebacteria bacterium]|nr:50S ribosomal protein L29 [Candidatus Paceibacterota bacterium]
MKAQELRKKSKIELEKLLKENREILRKLRFNAFTGKLKNIAEIKKTRKQIARILTLLNI